MAGLGVLLLVMFITNPHFYRDPHTMKVPAALLLLGLVGTAVHCGHIWLWARRPVYNQQSLTYTVQIGVLWWTAALALGLGAEGIYYVFEGSAAWHKTPWVGTILAVTAATILIPLCLILSAFAKHLKKVLSQSPKI